MKGFEFTLELYGIEITKIHKQGNTTMVETGEIAITIDMINKITLIKGLDQHIYKLYAISTDNLNKNNEIRLIFWYEDLTYGTGVLI